MVMETLFSRRMATALLGRVAATTALGLGLSRGARAAKLGQPTEKVILTISGQISETNKDGAAEFDRPMLEALGMESFSTTTPWYDGPVKFEGVRMSRLLDT